MTFEDDILDAGQINEFSHPNDFIVEASIRFGHFVIDVIIRLTLITVVTFLINLFVPLEPTYLIIYIIYFIYHPLMEFFFGKTIAKMMTKSTVVNENGGKIIFRQAILRSLCRFIPFNLFSFLGSKGIGWHDRISKTRVVNDSFLK